MPAPLGRSPRSLAVPSAFSACAAERDKLSPHDAASLTTGMLASAGNASGAPNQNPNATPSRTERKFASLLMGLIVMEPSGLLVMLPLRRYEVLPFPW